MSRPRYSVVVPCYNEEGAVAETIASLRANLPDPSSYELIVVNDGSSDGSMAILERLVTADPQLRLINHERNQGYGAALKTGIRRAHSELIVITDADGSYPTSSLPPLIELAESSDMVVGARTGQHVSYPLLRRLPKFFMRSYVTWLAGQSVPDMNSGMRAFKRSVVERFINVLPNSFSFTTTITLALLRNRYDVQFIPIDYLPRKGKSKIRPFHDTLNFSQLILRTGMYFAPLRVLLPVALVMFLAFLASFAYDLIVLRNLTDKSVLLLLFASNTGIFALLADMIDKRCS